MEEQHQAAAAEETEQAEAIEFVLFHVNESYVYLVPTLSLIPSPILPYSYYFLSRNHPLC